MEIQELKDKIESKNTTDLFVIFQCKDCNFVADQYIHEIARQQNKSIEYLESLDNIVSSAKDIFGISEINSDSIRVYSCESFEFVKEDLKRENNLFIVTKKVDKNSEKVFQDYIVDVPKLELWQIKDYVYSNLEGIEPKKLDWFIEVCQQDIYRIDNEMSKLKMFNSNERKYLFDSMINDGCFRDVSTFNVFNITNAVTSKDINLLYGALKEVKSFDAEPLGVVTLLYQGFKKLMQVWLAKNPTPENTGLKSNVIYAINKSPRVYSKEQLIRCFLEMTDIDRKLKTGNLCDMKNLIDYCVCKVLCI